MASVYQNQLESMYTPGPHRRLRIRPQPWDPGVSVPVSPHLSSLRRPVGHAVLVGTGVLKRPKAQGCS